MKIAVVGVGYVGLSVSILLAERNEVVALDLDVEKVTQLQNGKSPIVDHEAQARLDQGGLSLTSTSDPADAYRDATYVVIATPTDFDPNTAYFDTSSVTAVAKQAREYAPEAHIIIKSTIPVGFTEGLRKELGYEGISFSPEFLREGRALYDNLYPSRIIVGGHGEKEQIFADLLKGAAKIDDVEVLLTGSTEAEAIKLFSNTYLAMRVAYFNELDNYAMAKGLDSKEIIDGVSADPRIGDYYNNPSFGYGGYCLPKDSKQLLANYDKVPQNMIHAIVESNTTRKDFMAQSIMDRNPEIVGIYRLTMKNGSDNFRYSSIQGIMNRLARANQKMIVYEPYLDADEFLGAEVIRDFDDFTARADVIVANRHEDKLAPVKDKVFSRDLFGSD